MISLDNNTYTKLGQKFAQDGKWRTALLYFSKCDNYESYINRLYILMNSKDAYWTKRMAEYMRAKFEQTHNLAADVVRFAPEFWHTFLKNLFEKDCLSGERISADATLMLDKNLFEMFPDDEGISIEDIVELLGEEQRNLYLLNSEDHFEFIKNKIARYTIEGQFDKVDRVQDELLEMKTDYLPALESKLMVYIQRRQFDKAIEIAEEIYTNENLSEFAMLACLMVMVQAGNKKRKVKKILETMLKRPVLSASIAQQCIKISNDLFNDPEMALEFFDRISDEFLELFGLTVTQYYAVLCANNGESKEAIDTLIDLNRMLPEHYVNRCYLAYLQQRKRTPFLNISCAVGIPDQLRDFCAQKVFDYTNEQEEVPFRLACDCVLTLMQAIRNKMEWMRSTERDMFNFVLPDHTEDDLYPYIIYLCQKCVVKLAEKATDSELDFLAQTILPNGSFMITVSVELLTQLIARGYGKQLFVGVAGHWIDTSRFSWATDVTPAEFVTLVNFDSDRPEYDNTCEVFFKLCNERLQLSSHQMYIAFVKLFNVEVSEQMHEIFLADSGKLTRQTWKELQQIVDETGKIVSENTSKND